MTRDEAFKEYEQELAEIASDYEGAKKRAKALLHNRLCVIRAGLHKELKAVRALSQKTR